MYECETSFLTLREEQKIERTCYIKVLSSICGHPHGSAIPDLVAVSVLSSITESEVMMFLSHNSM